MADNSQSRQRSSSCRILSLPTEVQLMIFSYVTKIEDQAAASVTCIFWNTLLTSISHQKDHYSTVTFCEHGEEKSLRFHSLLRPNGAWLACEALNGGIISISLKRFPTREPECTCVASSLKFRIFCPACGDHSGVWVLSADDRGYADLSKPSIATLDISHSSLLDEPFSLPHSDSNDRFQERTEQSCPSSKAASEHAWTEEMLRKPPKPSLTAMGSFKDTKPVSVRVYLHSRETYSSTKSPFHGARLTEYEHEICTLTLRELLSTIVAQLKETFIAEDIPIEQELLFDLSESEPVPSWEQADGRYCSWAIKVFFPREYMKDQLPVPPSMGRLSTPTQRTGNRATPDRSNGYPDISQIETVEPSMHIYLGFYSNWHRGTHRGIP
ncbi:hypothetical protein Dda_5365 [Drechslerella dactyloides]|uniref:F-box domain-containing protein n=1 Tax=Drechslerella dactyloides TaxID=74499 RepID=A0AAD6IWM1_DREDA|nr:hypothetical protein Dda_5365 [Drechslerella dactyloides]